MWEISDLREQKEMLLAGLREMQRDLRKARVRLAELERTEQQQIGAITFVQELLKLRDGSEVETDPSTDESADA